jgi:formylglycine-generating enzyme required for sulfatase activity
MKFVPVPGTKVLFCIHETRRRDYQTFFASGYDASARYKIDGGWKTAKINGMQTPQGDDYPVAPVHSVDAQRFCDWLSEVEGVRYRLPTDREWSLSVGLVEDVGPNDTPETLSRKNIGVFPWGGKWPPPPATANYADTKTGSAFPGKEFIASYTDEHASSAPVMSCEPNSLGIYDLAGNVWEWCGDMYDSATKHRVLRGGAWDTSQQQMLFSSYRDHARDNEHAFKARGFRIVLEMPAP